MQDLRLAIRALRATPIVTAVAILSLALRIGANTTIFRSSMASCSVTCPWLICKHLAIVSGGIPTYALVPQRPGYTAGIRTSMHDQGAVFDGQVEMCFSLGWLRGPGHRWSRVTGRRSRHPTKPSDFTTHSSLARPSIR
jgi:hypothetical protein